mgnify:CR=1 FL=1
MTESTTYRFSQDRGSLFDYLINNLNLNFALQADTDHDFFHWKRHIQMVIDGQFCVEEEPLSSLDHREIINDFTPGKNEIKNHFRSN